MRAGKWVLLICTMAGTLVTCSKDDHVLNNPADPQSPAYVGHEVLSPKDVANFPTVAITNAPSEAKVGTAVTFVATASDPNPKGLRAGTLESISWNFGDGSAIVQGGLTQSHTFSTAGLFNVGIIVVDDDGNSTNAAKVIRMTRGLPPTVTAGGPYACLRNTVLTLNGSGNDPDGYIVKYEWDFNGNGSFDWSSTATGSVEHAFTLAGMQAPVLRVTDNDGNAATASASVAVAYLGDFESSSQLSDFTVNTAQGTFAVTAGTMRIQCADTLYIAEAKLKNATFADGTLEVTTQWVSGVNNHAYGIWFRGGNSNEYGLAISRNGSYVIVKWTNGQWGTLKTWTTSSAITTGPNVLKVVCSGSNMSFFINGTFLTAVSDASFTSGSVALWVGGQQAVLFDDFRITPTAGAGARLAGPAGGGEERPSARSTTPRTP